MQEIHIVDDSSDSEIDTDMPGRLRIDENAGVEGADETNTEGEATMPEEVYEVEAIIGKQVMYQVKWKGYEEPTWEPEQSVVSASILYYRMNSFQNPLLLRRALPSTTSSRPTTPPQWAAVADSSRWPLPRWPRTAWTCSTSSSTTASTATSPSW